MMALSQSRPCTNYSVALLSIALTSVTYFWRDFGHSFAFPIDDRAAVTAFSATVGGRTVVGRAKEKEAAMDSYDDAIASGHGAFLLDKKDTEDVIMLSV